MICIKCFDQRKYSTTSSYSSSPYKLSFMVLIYDCIKVQFADNWMYLASS